MCFSVIFYLFMVYVDFTYLILSHDSFGILFAIADSRQQIWQVLNYRHMLTFPNNNNNNCQR